MDDGLSTKAPQASALNSAAYALVQGLAHRYREVSYIEAIIDEPGALTEAVGQFPNFEVE